MTAVPPPPPMGMPVGASDEKNSLGVWSLVLGILSIICCGLVAGIPAIILGMNSKKAGAEGRATNANLGQIGFILGIVGTVLGTIGWIFSLTTGAFDFSTYSS